MSSKEKECVKNELPVDVATRVFDYSPETGVLSWSHRCGMGAWAGRQVGTPDSSGHLQVIYQDKAYMVHRIAWTIHFGALPTKYLDHHNTVYDDNRIENLRLATGNQNARNCSLRKDNSSGVKGVSWLRKNCKWSVRICVAGKPIFLGLYRDIELAELVAKEARLHFHGQFARHA